jgi:hypothetical protein
LFGLLHWSELLSVFEDTFLFMAGFFFSLAEKRATSISVNKG